MLVSAGTSLKNIYFSTMNKEIIKQLEEDIKILKEEDARENAITPHTLSQDIAEFNQSRSLPRELRVEIDAFVRNQCSKMEESCRQFLKDKEDKVKYHKLFGNIYIKI